MWQIRWFQETRKSPANKFYFAKITFKFQILFEFWCRNQMQPYKIIRQNFNIKPLTLTYMQWEKKKTNHWQSWKYATHSNIYIDGSSGISLLEPTEKWSYVVVDFSFVDMYGYELVKVCDVQSKSNFKRVTLLQSDQKRGSLGSSFLKEIQTWQLGDIHSYFFLDR